MPTTTPFNNLITFSRGSNATLTGPNGLIQWAPSNLLAFSEQFDNATWQKLSAGTGVAPAVTANFAVAPDGTTTADRVQFSLGGGTTVSDWSSILQSLTIANGLNYTYSVWLRSNDSNSYTLLARDDVGSGGTSVLWTVTPEWQRFSYTALSTNTASNGLRLWLRGTLGTSSTANVLLWGAQLEIGSAATTYNPTTVKNLLGFSEAFDNAPWSANGTSLVRGAAANPVNGLFTAQKLMETTAAGVHNCGQNVTTAAVPYTFSCYIKAAERTFAMLYHTQTNAAVSINLTTGATGTPTGIASPTSSSVVALGNGWYRLSMTVTATAASNFFGIYPLTSLTGSVSYTGDGNSGVYIYGAQLSDSASLDPYVPTPGAAPSSTAFYGPRFDFDPVTLLPRGLLVEEQRTNLLLRSEEFDNAAWGKSASSVSANATTSPDGTVNADKLVEDTSTGQHALTVSVSTTGISYTLSIYAKASERTQIALVAFGASTVATYFNLTNGTVVSGTGTITNAGNGWYRCSIVFTGGAASTLCAIYTAVSGSNSYAGNGTSGIFLYGAQLEAGAFATSYIPTLASTVTRSADVATITGQNFAQWYRQDEGAFVAEFDALTSASLGSANVLSAYASGTNLNRIWMWTGAPGVVRNSVVSGGAGVSELTGATLVANTPLKAASSYRVDSYAFTTNGGAVGSDTAGALPVGISVLGVGNIGGPSEYLNGHIRSIRFIPARAADFQLQALTT